MLLRQISKWGGLRVLAGGWAGAGNGYQVRVGFGDMWSQYCTAVEEKRGDQGLGEELEMTPHERKKIVENLMEVVENPMEILKNPESHPNLTRNLQLLKGLGMEKWEVKRQLSGGKAVVVKDPEVLEENMEWLRMEFEFSTQEVRRILTRFPRLMEFKIGGDMSSVKGGMEEIGISWGEFKKMVRDRPQILLEKKVDEKTKAMIEVLGRYDIGNDRALGLVKIKPELVTYDLEKVEFMLGWVLLWGVEKSDLYVAIRRCPRFFAVNSVDKAQMRVRWLQEHLEIEQSLIVKRIFVKSPALFAKVTINVMKERLDMFKDAGFSANDVRNMVLKYPGLFDRRPAPLERGIKFFLETLEKPPAQVARFPAFMGLSLPNRLLFRAAFLDCKGEPYKDKNVRAYVGDSDSKFFKPFPQEEVVRFQTWWSSLNEMQKFEAFEKKLYLHDLSKAS